MSDLNKPKPTPNQNNKAEIQKQQPKQPEIAKDKLDKLFAGIQILPQIKAIGASLKEKLPKKPVADSTESDRYKAKYENLASGYDFEIAKKQQIIDTLNQSSQSNIASALKEQERIKANLQYTKEFHASAGDRIVKEKLAQENENFEKANPELVEAKVNKETKQNLKNLKDQYSNAKDSEQRDQIQAQIDIVNKSHQLQLEKLGGYKQVKQSEKIANEQKAKSDKSEAKSQASIDKIKDKVEQKEAQKRLDDSIRSQFQKTMDSVKTETKDIKTRREEEKQYNKEQDAIDVIAYARVDNINKIRKTRLKDEKSVEKFQSKLEAREEKASQKEYEDEVYSRAKNISNIRKQKNADEKAISKEQKKGEKLTAKAEKGGIFDKLKRGIDKMKNQSKSNSEARESAERENNPNYKGDVIGIAAKNAGEKMKRAYNKIKDSLKVDHDKEPLIPAKIAELKAKKKTSKLEVGNITTKIDPNKTKSSFVKLKDSIKNITKKKSKVEVKQSDKMKELSSELMSKQIDLKEAQKLLKSIQKETTRAGKKDPESDEYAVLDHQLRDIYNLVKQIELEVNIAEADSFAQAAIEKAQHNPEQEMANESAENKAKASKALEELTFQKEEAIKELKDKKARMNKRKGTKEKEFIKINKQIQKTNDDFNEKIQIQKSILNSQE